MALLEVKDLTVSYGELTIVNDVSFTVCEGDWLMIAGPNGAGKSTVVNAIAQNAPYTGSVKFENEDVRRIKPAALAKKLGVLSQSHNVSYSFNVLEVARLGRYAYAPKFLSVREDAGDAVLEALERTGLTKLKNQSVLTLSGGELQRVFLAQLFAQDPQLLILDEPTNHLDLAYQRQVFELIEAWRHEKGRAVISVVHDLSLARAYGTSALLLSAGKTAALGSVSAALSQDMLEKVYSIDVYGYMREMLGQWQ